MEEQKPKSQNPQPANLPANPMAGNMAPDPIPPAQPVAGPGFDPSQIYGGPVNNPSGAASAPSTAPPKSTPQEAFAAGYSVGGTIFWYQLLVGILVGVISSALLRSVAHSNSASLVKSVALLTEAAGIIVAIYVPFNILRSDGDPLPLWRAVFASSLESIFSLALFVLYVTLFIATVFGENGTSRLIAGNPVLIPVYFIATLIISYFLTKLAYGYTFKVFSRPNSDRKIKIVTVGLLALVLSITLGAKLAVSHLEHRDSGKITYNNASSGINGLQPYTVPGEPVNGSPEFTVSFYRNAKVQPKNGLEYLISTGSDGTESSIWIYRLKAGIPNCAGGVSFNLVIMGNAVPGCYRDDRIIFTAEIVSGTTHYQVNLVSQKPIEVSEAISILNSVALK